MTATAQFSRPIIVGIVYLAAIVRFLTSLARRKETKPALNQHGSYRKFLVKRRLVKVMPDILIQGYSAPASCATCHFNSNAFCDVLGRKVKIPVDYVERPNTCPLVELPPHGELIDRDALAFKDDIYGWRDKKIVKAAPVIIPAERREG